MPILAASGDCHHQESVVTGIAAETRSPRVLSPFRVLHSQRVGGCYQLLPLLPFIHIFSDNGRDFSGLIHTAGVPEPVLRPILAFTLLGVAALQGFPPGLSFSMLPPNPPLRLDGWRALLSVPVGIYTT